MKCKIKSSFKAIELIWIYFANSSFFRIEFTIECLSLISREFLRRNQFIYLVYFLCWGVRSLMKYTNNNRRNSIHVSCVRSCALIIPFNHLLRIYCQNTVYYVINLNGSISISKRYFVEREKCHVRPAALYNQKYILLSKTPTQVKLIT